MSTDKADRALGLLDFERIRNELCALALSDEGRGVIRTQSILTERLAIGRLLEAAGEWKLLLERGAQLPELQFPPIQSLLPLLAKEGSVGEAIDLASVGVYVASAARLKRFLKKPAADLYPEAIPRLSGLADSIPGLSDLASKILAILEPDGSLKEDEIPALKAIRRRMQRLRTEIEQLTSGYMGGDRSIWQSDVPTQKDGRTVLPLKSSHRSRIRGIVHEVSATGATLYIEPYDIVDRNNELVQQENRYRQEVFRILRDLTSEVRAVFPELESLVTEVAFIDSLFARARYSELHSCVRAGVLQTGIALIGARHPLLGEIAVPIDVVVDEGTRVLIITGPNTGGKTVALKTVGLLALMNQFGMEVPALPGTAFALFDKVFVDIGDEQSIENSLSTFSAHMRNIAEILKGSTAQSLVLLDEIGSGTDPSEGSGIAVSILEKLRGAGTVTIATTHHGVIKNWGFTTPQVTNASVAFDEVTLNPTFKVIMGLPGESHALEIAERNGIDAAVIGHARAYIEGESTSLSRAIRELSQRQHELVERIDAAGRREREIDGEKAKLARRESQLRDREIALKHDDLRDLRRYLEESRRNLENLVRELRAGEITREKTRKVKDFLAGLEAAVAGQEAKVAESDEDGTAASVSRVGAKTGAEAAAQAFAPGVEVFVGVQRRKGTVVRHAGGNRWIVAVKTLRLTVPEDELVPVPVPAGSPSVSVAVADITTGNAPAFELDLRGMRLEAALRALESQIDRAILSGLSEILVIHGKGEGVLQEGVHGYLRTCPAVKDYFFSRPEEGGFGKTMVILGPKER